MKALHFVHWIAVRCIAWPLVLFGFTLSMVGGALIHSGAWIADVDVNDENQWL